MKDLYKIKFEGLAIEGTQKGQVITGDLIRKGSRFGGAYHYIYIDGDIDEVGVYILVDASTIKIIGI